MSAPETATAWPSDCIPTEAIKAFCRELQPSIDVQIRRATDTLYEELMVSVQDYLCENAEHNIKSKFDAQQREVISAHGALNAVEEAITFQEAKANAYAARKGFWTPQKAAEYRAEAEALIAKARGAQ